MKVTKLGRKHMKIGETFSHHPMVHTEWFNFIHAGKTAEVLLVTIKTESLDNAF